eukprot:CAMPEP_0183717584 /NCGR_PEP_ID=MMETSP0737-20130205/11169_1 /TAXON_ID=385413 /ORGANISM="Thalassiosira miniscula, Strain CCMP1093" /LENGTH=103 /DNA_ID=CAMNT_0025947057 /DNA_START=9 /DNA_END=317 /DNA_ORIENTATION=+
MMQLDQKLLHQEWKDVRLKVSTALGSIGAPPLSSSTRIHTSDHHSSSPSVAAADRVQSQNHLNALLEMANAHAELLATMHRMVELLSVGTGIRLGLGSNGGRL